MGDFQLPLTFFSESILKAIETLYLSFFFCLPAQKIKVGREREIWKELKELEENFAREEDSFLPA